MGTMANYSLGRCGKCGKDGALRDGWCTCCNGLIVDGKVTGEMEEMFKTIFGGGYDAERNDTGSPKKGSTFN